MSRAVIVGLLVVASAFGQSTPLRTPEDAERAERALASNPEDLKLRTDLIVYYNLFAVRVVSSRLIVDEAAVQRRVEHILWLTEHHPEAAILGKREGMVQHAGDRRADAAAHAKAAAIWRRHAAEPGAPAAVLANAGFFFRLTERELGEALLLRALRLKPDELTYSEALGVLYAQAMSGVTVEFAGAAHRADRGVARSAFAKHARSVLDDSKDVAMLRAAAVELALSGIFAKREARLDYDPNSVAEQLLLRARSLNPSDFKTFEAVSGHYSVRARAERNRSERVAVSRKWLNLLLDEMPRASGSYQRSLILADAGKAAYLAEQAPAAAGYARQALAMVQQDPKAWYVGDVAHRANTVLGLVAADRGDVRAATEFLIASARVQGSAVLSSFGPSTILAKRLLEKDERQPVLEYLRLCAGFWTLGIETQELQEWTEQVQAGRMPTDWRLAKFR